MSQHKLLIYLIAFISTIALISFSLSPFFEVSNFEYKGLKILKDEEISNLLQEYENSNILYIDHRDIKRNLLKQPYIESVVIKKVYPDNIIIDIKERKPIAKIINDGQFLSFTSNGFIVEIGTKISKISVPEIKGLGYSLNNNEIKFSTVLNKIVQALKVLDTDIRSRLETVIYNDNKNIVAYFNKIPVNLGVPNQLVEKFKILQSVIIKISEEKLDVEYVDLNLFKKPVIKLK